MLSGVISASTFFRSPDYVYITGGGTETHLTFKTDFPLRHDAAFEALFHPRWFSYLLSHNAHFVSVIASHGRSMLLDTETWRASAAWFDKLCTPRSVRAVVLAQAMAPAAATRGLFVAACADGDASRPHPPPPSPFLQRNVDVRCLVVATIGPRSDAYAAGDATLDKHAHAQYHAAEVDGLARAGADVVAAYTLGSSAEGAGVVRAAPQARLMAFVSFTMDEEGRLPGGEMVGEAVKKADRAWEGDGEGEQALFYMVNCVYPTQVAKVLTAAADKGEEWVARIKGVGGELVGKVARGVGFVR